MDSQSFLGSEDRMQSFLAAFLAIREQLLAQHQHQHPACSQRFHSRELNRYFFCFIVALQEQQKM